MKSARFLLFVVLLLPLLAACVASPPTYVWKPLINPSAYVSEGGNQIPEKTFCVSGYVLDAVSCRPVIGVVVGGLDFGSSFRQPRTDSNGYFLLRLPISRWKVGSRLNVNTLFYEGGAVIPADTMQPVNILLKHSAYRKKRNSCQQTVDTIQPPPYNASPILGVPGTQFAFLIRDSTARPPQKLRTLTFQFGNDGFPSEPFRIRIYRYNGPQLPPGEDLLTENCTVQDTHEGLSSFDISAYDISLPATGLFISLEWLVTELRGITYPIQAYTPTGPILRPPCARADIRTWEYVIGQGWHRATAVENCWPLYESALSVEVESAPAPPAKR